jgi:hypothetical protein
MICQLITKLSTHCARAVITKYQSSRRVRRAFRWPLSTAALTRVLSTTNHSTSPEIETVMNQPFTSLSAGNRAILCCITVFEWKKPKQ